MINNLIVASSFVKSMNYYEQLKEDFKNTIVSERIANGNCLATTINNDSYRVISASINSRGVRCDRIYIDREVSDDILRVIFFPMIVNRYDILINNNFFS